MAYSSPKNTSNMDGHHLLLNKSKFVLSSLRLLVYSNQKLLKTFELKQDPKARIELQLS